MIKMLDKKVCLKTKYKWLYIYVNTYRKRVQVKTMEFLKVKQIFTSKPYLGRGEKTFYPG